MPTDHEARARELLEPYECRGDHCGNRYVLKLDATEAAQVLAQALAETEAAAWNAAVEAAEQKCQERRMHHRENSEWAGQREHYRESDDEAIAMHTAANCAEAIRTLRKAKP